MLENFTACSPSTAEPVFKASKEEVEAFFKSRVWDGIAQLCQTALQYQIATILNKATTYDTVNFLRGSIEQLSIVLDWPNTLPNVAKETNNAGL